MPALYSEYDKKAAAWLRELIKRGLIADGVVDERDLWDVAPADLRDFTQVHLCAGIGVWSYAARRAGISDDRRIWTASFPCQPFSAAGKGKGFTDERHLWPAGLHLIRECRPDLVFGEQVASKDAEPWIDLVQDDLEALDYAVGAVPFPSAGVGAPHIRDRLYWVAQSGGERQPRERLRIQSGRSLEGHAEARWGGEDGIMANANDARPQGRSERGHGSTEWPAGASGVAGRLADPDGRQRNGQPVFRGSERDGQDARRAEGSSEFGARRYDGGVADAAGARHTEAREHERGSPQFPARPTEHGGVGGLDRIGIPDGARASREHGPRDLAAPAGPTNGLWRSADWLFSRDGQWRPVEPGTFPLAHGAASRVGRLRGYGNAINAEAAQIFIESYLEACG